MTSQVNEIKRVEQTYEDVDKKLRTKGFFPVGTAARALEENPRVVRTWAEAFFTYVHAHWDDHARLWLQEASMDPLRNIQHHLQKTQPTPTLRELKALLTWEGKVDEKAHPTLVKKVAPAPTEPNQEILTLQAVQRSVQEIQKSMETLHSRLESTEGHMIKMCDAIENLNSNLTSRRQDERINKKLQKFFDEVRQWQTQIRSEIKDIQFKQHFTSSFPSSAPPRRQQKNKPKFLGIF